jgi:hypothetical protein
MRFNKTGRIVAAIAVIGAVAAGGAAFTDSNAMPTNSVAGFGTTSVSGGTVTSLQYALSGDGYYIDTATIVFQGDVSADTASIGLSDGATVGSDGTTDGTLVACGSGSYVSGTGTTFSCDLSSSNIVTATVKQADITLTGPST